MQSAKVISKRVFLDRDGMPEGSYNRNPILDTRAYEVMFPDGELRQYSVNVIAENMHAQVDSEGYHYCLLDEIVSHQSTNKAVKKEDSCVYDKYGNASKSLTTKGWYLNVQWKDGTKESNPIEVAEYALRTELVDEPAFAWWVPHTVKKRDWIIASVSARVRKKTHKFSIHVPATISDAHELNKLNGNDFWRRVMEKEMKNTAVAVKHLEEGQNAPPGYGYALLHLIFDVEMNLT
jgi:hypothetical protein